MYKYILAFLPVLFLALPVSANAAYDIAPTSGTYTTNWVVTGGHGQAVIIDPDGFAVATYNVANGSSFNLQNTPTAGVITPGLYGTYTSVDSFANGCNTHVGGGNRLEDVEASCSFSTVVSFTVSAPPPPPPPPFSSIITDADNGFASSTGFGIASLVEWSGLNLVLTFVGSGLAVLGGYANWIVVFAVIWAIIAFSWGAYRWLQNKRR